MVELTRKQMELLIKQEDHYTIRKFAKLFNCSPKEVYAIYDRITETPEYKEYTKRKVALVTGKLFKKREEEENAEVERTSKNRKGEKRYCRISPLLFTTNNNSNNTTDSTYPDNVRGRYW